MEFGRLISPKFGIVRGVNLNRFENANPFSVIANADLGDLSAVGGINSFGSGFNSNVGSAKAAAVGEFIERYCSTLIFPGRMTDKISYNELSKKNKAEVLLPSLFSEVTEAQMREAGLVYESLTAERELNWVAGERISDKSKVFIPAFAAVFNSRYSLPVNSMTSSGLSCGASLENAVKGGLLEIIERDAIMAHWWCRMIPPQLEMDDIKDPWISDAIRYFSHTGRKLNFLLIRTNCKVPVVLAVLTSANKKGDPAISMTAAANMNIDYAVKKTLFELFQGLGYRRRDFSQFIQKTFDSDFNKSINNFKDIVGFYFKDQNRIHTEFLTSGEQRIKISDIRKAYAPQTDNLAGIISLVRETGHEAYSVDFSTEELQKVGLFACRVIVPGYLPINARHIFRCLNQKRLYELPMKLGYRKDLLKPEELNKMPHPFP